MQSFMISILCLFVLHRIVHGIHFRNFLNEATFENSYEDSSVSFKPTDFKTTGDSLGHSSNTSELYNTTSEFRTEKSSEIVTNETSLHTDQTNATLIASDSSHTTDYSPENMPNSSSTHKVTTLTEIFGNESQSSNSFYHSSSEFSSTASGGTVFIHSLPALIHEVNGTSPVTDDDDEPEGVARGKPNSGTESVNSTMPKPQTIYQKTMALISDTYTMSILVPIAAGIVFASTIIIIIATCKCLRRRYRRRRLRRKVLPDSVKNLRPSDRARLLAESSDEEF